MGISRWVQAILYVFASPSADQDYTLDTVIREALFEDALAQPSPSAWNRLRTAIVDRQFRAYGMWVLDEPLRDPPDLVAARLNGEQQTRGMYLHAASREGYNRQIREAMWGTILPTFSALVNW